MSFGIYIHIPFCRRKCPYCDFYSAIPKGEQVLDDYAHRVVQEIQSHSDLPPVTSVYFGGGTPNVLGSHRIAAILTAIRDHCTLQDGEITVECNPESVTAADFITMAEAGVNRISMGVQSAVERERRALGRVHSNEQVLEAVKNCRRAGIANISLDFMLGIPYQTSESLEETLAFLTKADVPHLSLYLLSVEEGTPFARKHPPIADADEAADLYEQAARYLTAAGYVHYEISNFAKDGLIGHHNTGYWRCEEYLGIGPGAHSYYKGKRFFAPRDTAAFLDGTLQQIPDGDGGSFFEHVMLGLRLREGIDLAKLGEKWPSETQVLLQEADLMLRHGLMERDGETLRISESGFLLSNTIISNLFTEK